MIAYNSDEATASDRVKMYINGVQQTDFSTANYPTSGATADINTAIQHTIGATTTGSASFMDGYLADYYFIDGQALTPSSFGHTATDTGKWVPSDTSGLTFGTNGFRLDFNDDRSSTPDTTTTIYDQSGNSNNWTGTSLIAGSFRSDTPVDNYATLNVNTELDTAQITYSIGNTWAENSSVAAWRSVETTIPLPSTGKFAFYVSQLGYALCGVGARGVLSSAIYIGQDAEQAGIGAAATTGTWSNGVLTNSGFTPTDTIRWCAVDMDTGKIWLGYNGSPTWIGGGDPVLGTSPTYTLTQTEPWFFQLSANNISASNYNIGFNMQGAVASIGGVFKVLSSANLPIPDALYRKPQNFADLLLYTGNGTAIGSGGNAVTGLDFQPDFVWVKTRDASRAHVWYDSIRGANKSINSNSTAAEATTTEGLNSFDVGGFTTGSLSNTNANTEDFWAMCIKADNTAGSSNTDGSVTTTVSAGQHFSIVQWSGDGATTITAGHGLPFAPDLIILKDKDSGTGGWQVYHSSNTSAPETDYLLLHATNATVDNVNRWNDTAPTNEVFTVHSNINGSGTNNMIAYCIVFDTTDPNSPFTGGVYEGNNSTDGTFIPSDGLQMLMYKAIDTTGQWYIRDAVRDIYNPSTTVFTADSATNEAPYGTGQIVDLLSNGWKCRQNGTTAPDMNAVETYIWWGIKKDGGQLWA
jgi:hypothetical protein